MEDINPEELFGNPEELFRSKKCRTITMANFLVEQMKLLMELNLSGCNITDQGADTMATILLETASLEILDLSETMLNTIKVIKINNSLIKNISCLKTFNINNNDIDDDATESIAAVICNNCLIGKLNISNNKFSYTGVLNIAKSLLVTKNIRVFDISNNFIKSDCTIELAATLSKCPILQEINISHCSLSLANVLTIAQSFRYHPTLQILDMSTDDDNNGSFSSACECIVDIILSVNQAIVSLNVCGRNIRPRYIEDYLSPQNNTTDFTLQRLKIQCSSLGVDISNAQTKLIKAMEPCPILSDDIISYYVNYHGAAFYNQYHNFAILIPPGAVLQGERVEIQATANYFGPFKIPDGLYPISSYYWFSANYEFKTPVYLIMNHYARIRSLEDVANLHVLHACTHDINVMNEMNTISDGVYFDYEIGFCVLATKHFCSYCQAKGVKHIPERLLACYCTYDDPNGSLIAEVSFCPSNSHCNKVT